MRSNNSETPDAFVYRGVVVVFAGPSRTADDIICDVRSKQFYSILNASKGGELASRSRRAGRGETKQTKRAFIKEILVYA